MARPHGRVGASDPSALRDVVALAQGTIAGRGLLSGGETVLVAVSGGPDSTALLVVLDRLRAALRLTLHVAHLDHALRDGSAADAAYVRRLARRLGYPARVERAEGGARPPGRSPEEAARDMRLAFLERVAAEVGATRIATGHTLDDQAETVLMRLLSGAGRRGLGGIPPRRGPYIRPLIDVRRSQTEAACRALRLRPRRDPTNRDTSLLRNAVRRELLPVIAGRYNARAAEALARTADVLREEDALLDELAAAAAPAEPVEGGMRISVNALAAAPRALRRRAVRLVAPLDAAATDRVLALAARKKTGASLDLGLGLRARTEYGWLVVGREPHGPAAPATAVALSVPGETALGEWGLVATTWIETGPPAEWPDGRTVCVVDAAAAGTSLRVRAPRRGDRFRPLGMRGEKKVGDMFTDEKVPRDARARVPLVVDDGGRIVWVAGHRIDERVRATERTTAWLWMAIGAGEDPESAAERRGNG